MRVRFRIRTLMVAVVGVALVCALLAALPEIRFTLGVLALVCVGPTIGAAWAALRYRPGRLDPVSGGMTGGAAQTALILAAGILTLFHDPGALLAYLPGLGLAGLFLLALHVLIGAVVGGLIWACDSTFGDPRVGRRSGPARRP